MNANIVMSQKPAQDINLEELRRELTWHLAVFQIATSALVFWFILARTIHPTIELIPWVALFAIGIAVFVLNHSWPRIARYLLVAAMAGALIGQMYLSGASWIPFLALPLAFVSALLIAKREWIVTAAVGGVAWWFASNGIRHYPFPALPLVLAGGTVLAWLVVHSVYTALEWAWTARCRAMELLEQSRDHQEELNRLVKKLEQAYAVQLRTQRELYLARKQADEARRMKERFAANISHELRTPLNLILGFSEIMYLSPEIYGTVNWPSSLRRDIHHIYRSSRHLLEMIDDILDLSRLDLAEFTLNKEPTSIEALLVNTAEMTRDLFRLKSVGFNLEIEEPLPTLEIDRTRIRQVLLNLLNNAQRFTENGRVTLTARKIDSEVIISISDTGAGIPADKLPHVFEEFFQVDHSLRRRHEGAGLGLAICKRFVEAHQGRIWLESEEGQGSTFYFSLPLADKHFVPAHAVTRAADLLETEERQSVLVIDPDPRVPALVARHLPTCEIIQVADAAQVDDYILTHHPHAVIYNAPPGMSHERNLISLSPVPWIECSLPSQSWMAQDLRVMAFLPKPVLAEDLLTQIERLDGVQTILIIDDDRGFCHLIERILHTKNESISMLSAYDGEDGLRLMRSTRPDLLLLDLIMPDIDGFHVLHQMREDEALSDIPVILLTASTYAEDALVQHESCLSIRRSGGLNPVEVLSCLEALVRILGPKYDLDIAQAL